MRRKRDAKKADVDEVEAEVEATAEGILFQHVPVNFPKA